MTSPVAQPSAVDKGRYSFRGGGLDLLLLELINALLFVMTFGLASFFGVLECRRGRWRLDNAVLDGRPFRCQAGWTGHLVHAIVSSLLVFCTCGLGMPWAIARERAFFVARTTTEDGRRLRFDGTGTEVFGVFLLSVLLICLTFGLAWPWVAVMWRAWATRHTIVDDPGAPAGAYRLRFHGTGLGFLVQGMMSYLLVVVTLGLYTPWAIANYERWAWAGTSDELSPAVRLPVGPRTPAQWALAAVMALATLLVLALFASAGVSLRTATRPASASVAPGTNATLKFETVGLVGEETVEVTANGQPVGVYHLQGGSTPAAVTIPPGRLHWKQTGNPENSGDLNLKAGEASLVRCWTSNYAGILCSVDNDTATGGTEGETAGHTATRAVATNPDGANAPPAPRDASLNELLTHPHSWTVEAALIGRSASSQMPCTTTAEGEFTCQDDCGQNVGHLRPSADGNELALEFVKVCGRAKRIKLTYRVTAFDPSSIRLERKRDWQQWRRNDR